jgi:2,3-bisphosphoglycerate-independent phosphoglycerate mutase
MSLKLNKISGFTRRPGPLLLVVMDGIGIGKSTPANAVYLAKKPNLDRLFSNSPLQTQLLAHGPAVGLPSWDDMGNSEVGHNALGAGQIFDQGAKLVNRAIADKTIFQSATWKALVSAGVHGGTLHFIGLLSDGNVHSHLNHLLVLLEEAAKSGAKRLAVHALLDGRDVQPRSALKYIDVAETFFKKIEQQYGCRAFFASGGGRMVVTMDRYNADWRIVERGWRAHVEGEGRKFTSLRQAVETQYSEDKNVIDQYLEAFVITSADGKPLAPMNDGDGVIFFNFRGDRAIEISRAFEEKDFKEFVRHRYPQVIYAGMMQYDGDLQLPKRFLVEPPQLKNTMGEYLAAMELSSFAISETQKYGHVTYFWNGNRSGYIDERLECYVEIPSDRIPFNQRPEMKAAEITTATLELLKNPKNYDFGRINYPNGDMVGHTGDLPATIRAVEVVDQQLGRILGCIQEVKGIAVILADHGNADEMFTEEKGVRVVKTAHTLNPVPFFIVDPLYQGEYQMEKVAFQKSQPGLANVAATLFNLMGYQAPKEYEPSLVSFK